MATKKAKKEPTKKISEDELSKSSVEGFLGGLKVDLDRRMSDGQELRDVLSSHFCAVLRREISNQEGRIDDINRWQRIYKGYRDPKSFPWQNCANLAVPISRSNADAIFVRIISAIWDKSKVWLFKALKPELIGLDRDIEEAMDWFQKNILKFKQKMLAPLLQCVKTGTGIVKIWWEEQHRTPYRQATDEEIKDKSIKKYKTAEGGPLLVKYTETTYRGPNIYSIDRTDFIISSDAVSIQDAYIVGFKKPMRKPEIELKARQGLYYQEAVDKMKEPSSTDETKEQRAEMQGKEISYEKDIKPYDIWELWVKYDVDEDGEEDDVVLTLNLESGAILRAIYNPLFKEFRPFIDFTFYPTEYVFDGEGVVEILEKPQIELDALHNQRLDRLTQISNPMIFVRAGSGLEDFKQSPGKTVPVTDELETTIREFKYSDVFYSTFNEEALLISYMDRAVGITESVLGIAESERPVAKETFARQYEANRKFRYGISNVMFKVTEIAYMFLEFFAQYQPEFTYETRIGEKIEERTVDFPIEYIRDGFRIDVAASSDILTQEHRREIELTKYQILSDYYTKTAGMIMAITSPETTPEFKQFLMSIIQKGDALIDNILADFDEKDTERYLIRLEETVPNINAIVQRQPLPTPPMPGAGQPQQPMQPRQPAPIGGIRR